MFVRRTCNQLRRFYATSSEREVRVRFAPSPTGFLHLGSLRTAFYNYVFARKHNGKFILRVEDTDRTRTVPGAIDALEETLMWANLCPDEGPSKGGTHGPYIQSQRLSRYTEYGKEILESGHAYRCFCSELRLDLIRKEAAKNREVPRYDNRCRHLTEDEVKKKLDNNEPFTIRLKLTDGPLEFNDAILGPASINLSITEADPVIIKSDGYPTYHFANVVDDKEMNISHVLRGIEWHLSTPKHIMLYRAFGWEPPIFAHLPLITNTDGSKLSKRQDGIRVDELKQRGYLPEALISFVANIGGGFNKSIEDRVWDVDVLANLFQLQKVHSSSGKLDPRKMELYNRWAIQKRLAFSPNDLIKEVRKLLIEKHGSDVSSNVNDSFIEFLLKWSQDRIFTVNDLFDEFDFVWRQPDLDWSTAKFEKLGSLESILTDTICLIDEHESVGLSQSNIVDILKSFCAQRNLSFGKYMQMLRAAITNKVDGPPIAEVFQLLGKDKFRDYLQAAANYVQSTELQTRSL